MGDGHGLVNLFGKFLILFINGFGASPRKAIQTITLRLSSRTQASIIAKAGTNQNSRDHHTHRCFFGQNNKPSESGK
jgi:hypothetical protein